MKSPIIKFISPEELDGIASRLEAKPGDLLLFCADFEDTVARVLGGIRLELGRRLQLIDEDALSFVWVTDFPCWNGTRRRSGI